MTNQYFWTNLTPFFTAYNSVTSQDFGYRSSYADGIINSVIQECDTKKMVSMPKYPPSNCKLSNDGNNLILEFAMAGYKKQDISVSVTNNLLKISAALNSDETKDTFLHQGISQKAVDISMAIDEEFDGSEGSVEFNDGILRLSFPRSEKAQTHKLL